MHYWDYLGWKDKLAKKEYSRRQRKYAGEWKNPSGVYTPGVVFAGQEWRGYRGSEVPLKKELGFGVLKVFRDSPRNYRLRFKAQQETAIGLRLHFVVLGFAIKHWIKSGETLVENYSMILSPVTCK